MVTFEHGDDDEFDPELKQPVIKTVSKAEELAEQLEDFAQFYGHVELSLALSKVTICFTKLIYATPSLRRRP